MGYCQAQVQSKVQVLNPGPNFRLMFFISTSVIVFYHNTIMDWDDRRLTLDLDFNLDLALDSKYWSSEWFCVSEPGGCNPDAKRLYDEILSGYNKLVRPVKNVTDPVTVKVKLKLSQLIDVVRTLFIYIYINGCMMSVCVCLYVICQEHHGPPDVRT